MRLYPLENPSGEDVANDLEQAVAAKGKARLTPDLRSKTNPLLIGSGDRCKRVQGTCYNEDDPTVVDWMKSQDKSRSHINSQMTESTGVLVFVALAAAIIVLYVLPLEKRFRVQWQWNIFSPRTSRLCAAGVALSLCSAILPGAVLGLSAIVVCR
jgi:hypothetical protein